MKKEVTNEATKEVTKEVAKVVKNDSSHVVIAGIVTTAMYGKRNFSTGQKDEVEKYRISIKVNSATVQALKDAAKGFFDGIDDKWIPDWYKKDAAETEYLNFSSSFDIRIGELGVNNRMFDKGTMTEYIKAKGGNINESKIALSLTIKKGAVYPSAILVKELHSQTINDMFGDDNLDDLFAENPFENA